MTSPSPAPHPIERLNATLGRMLADISASVSWGGVSMPLHILISHLITRNLQRLRQIAESIRAGIYRRRRTGPRASRPQRVTRPSKPPGLVRQTFGWLLPLLPMPYWIANGYRAELEIALADPQLAAMIEVAPVALGRPLRSLERNSTSVTRGLA